MSMATLGILHPGAMGSSVGAAARHSGSRVLWCSAGRSAATQRRAREDGLEAVTSLRELVASSDVILSVCPPDAALEVARSVVESGFAGTFVDANAVSRSTALAIEAVVTARGARFVDGSLLGPPARPGRTTLLCLSGERAESIARLFVGSCLEPRVVGPAAGQASALKMAFAAWTKGSAALLLSVRALAEAEGVSEALLDTWARLSPELRAKSEDAALGAAPKAWRWVGEMREIADSYAAAGLPRAFHDAAAEIFARLAGSAATAASEAEPVSPGALLARLLGRGA